MMAAPHVQPDMIDQAILTPNERCWIRASGQELVHRFLIAVGRDWTALDGMITSTADLIEQGLLESPIPSVFAPIFSKAFRDEARAEAARVRTVIAAGGAA